MNQKHAGMVSYLVGYIGNLDSIGSSGIPGYRRLWAPRPLSPKSQFLLNDNGLPAGDQHTERGGYLQAGD
jgi:hypothetical protein